MKARFITRCDGVVESETQEVMNNFAFSGLVDSSHNSSSYSRATTHLHQKKKRNVFYTRLLLIKAVFQPRPAAFLDFFFT